MSPNQDDFPQIKRELVTKINAIKTHIDNEAIRREEVRVLLDQVSVAVFGDPMAQPPVEGYHARLKRIEEERYEEKKDKQNIKDNAINLAVGSAAIAVGGAICWIVVAIKEAFLKGH